MHISNTIFELQNKKIMQKLNKFIILGILLLSKLVNAQKSEIYNNQTSEFDKALSLYNDKQYLSAQILLIK